MTLAVEADDAARVAALCAEFPRLIHTFDAMSQDGGDERCLPLHRAAFRGDVVVLAALLDRGANPDALTRCATPDRGRATALHWAVRAGRTDAAALLLDRGAAIDLRDAAGATPLHGACERGQVSTATLLTRLGADHEARDALGRTPLLLAIASPAASGGDVAIMLIDHGVDVNAANPRQPRRYTALHACLDAGPHRLPVARRLLNAGADPAIADPDSRLTATQVAAAFVRAGRDEYRAYVDLFV